MKALIIISAVAATLSSCAEATLQAGNLSHASEMMAFDTKISCVQSIEPPQACLVSRMVLFTEKIDASR
jgi:hypothetical protein